MSGNFCKGNAGSRVPYVLVLGSFIIVSGVRAMAANRVVNHTRFRGLSSHLLQRASSKLLVISTRAFHTSAFSRKSDGGSSHSDSRRCRYWLFFLLTRAFFHKSLTVIQGINEL
ncbi:hypothetical protein BJ165DRAFT_1482954 [Panaeolus papilionaceus]|nr:hypothetical protein BJ165DRAFT_1482954 [Panaeolus papilionaceus]